MNVMLKYLKNCLVAVDQLANTVFGGSPDETISSRLSRYSSEPLAKPWKAAVDWVAEKLFGQKNHCDSSREPDDRHEDDILR